MVDPGIISRFNLSGLGPKEVESALNEKGKDLNGMLFRTNHICSFFHFSYHSLKMK